MRRHAEKFYLRVINYEKRFLHSLGKHFKLAPLSPALWKCEIRRQPSGWWGGWGWGDLQKYKYLWLYFPTSFPAPRLTKYCATFARKEQGAVLPPEGHGINSYPCQLQHRPGGTEGNGLFHRSTTYQQNNYHNWCEVTAWLVLSEHRPRKKSYPWSMRCLHQGPAVTSWAAGCPPNHVAKMTWGILVPYDLQHSIFWGQALHSPNLPSPGTLLATRIFKQIFIYKQLFPMHLHWSNFVNKLIKSSNSYAHLNHVLIKLLFVSITY